ncbi:MAG: NAD(P)-dependent oxidoreductase [Acidimicrobiales bacterium]
MKVFVAGATGVLGRATVPRLITAGHEVRGAARSTEKADQLRGQGAEPVTIDLFDPVSVRAAVDGCQGVIHMATNIPPLTKAWKNGAWTTNDRLRREGTKVLADACRDASVEVLVKESVSFFYDDGGDRWIDEGWPIERQEFSDASLDAEDMTLAFTGEGRRGVVLRFGLFYSHDARALEESLKTAKLGFGPMIGPAEAWRASIHVDDAARAVVSALGAPAGAYNVADEPITNGEWNGAFATAFGFKKLRATPRAAMKLGGRKLSVLGASRRIDSTRFREATGWAPVHRDAKVGLQAVAAAHQVVSA